MYINGGMRKASGPLLRQSYTIQRQRRPELAREGEERVGGDYSSHFYRNILQYRLALCMHGTGRNYMLTALFIYDLYVYVRHRAELPRYTSCMPAMINYDRQYVFQRQELPGPGLGQLFH
jgi:hypothetical protein